MLLILPHREPLGVFTGGISCATSSSRSNVCLHSVSMDLAQLPPLPWRCGGVLLRRRSSSSAPGWSSSRPRTDVASRRVQLRGSRSQGWRGLRSSRGVVPLMLKAVRLAQRASMMHSRLAFHQVPLHVIAALSSTLFQGYVESTTRSALQSSERGSRLLCIIVPLQMAAKASIVARVCKLGAPAASPDCPAIHPCPLALFSLRWPTTSTCRL
ncbi:hypothetical protein FB567DRAFT_539255 [Paraphoma chrysanthemicola]|uniref:Uncharacterized protein n=1 Tax=Paraphoma chrysanthemicola TaxID=798071 RepID=A0A8K0QUG2_9PLEO|nr:hypothetical protein FB567DRAFT_539255 [Paraphoma chrysanthemicola]